MWELDDKESWTPKNWCFWTVVLEKTLESPLDCREIQPVYPKGNQSWIFIGRTDAENKTPIIWPPDAKNWLTRKDPDAGKDWGQEEKGTTEDEIVGWHHWLTGHEFEWTPAVGYGQGSLACCSPWGRKERLSSWTDWTDSVLGAEDTLRSKNRWDLGTSLVVQWLRLHGSKAAGLIPGRGSNPTCYAVQPQISK